MKRTWVKDVVEKVGKKVVLFGWINSKRDHGEVVFLDLRDRSGVVQLVGGKELAEFSLEDVVAVEGKVTTRDPRFFNPRLATGKVEVQVEKITLISSAKTLPFDIYGSGKEINEEVRLKYRYLDLRRPRLQRNLYLRHQALQLFRRFLTEEGFWEIETPNLSKSTPEGARDFLVPSRLHPGKFYALPQSPQQYKQLLMVAGIERYFQIATCFRDEDLRADRQFEFKQVDIEMSFVERDDVLEVVEKIVTQVAEALGKKIYQKPFPRLTYQEAMKKFHQDKFDLRENKKEDVLAFAWVIDFPLFEKTETREINPMHHPFTAPHPEDIKLLDKDPLAVRSWQYDLVCNGEEVGGGSIRITDPKIQEKIFRILGHSPQEIKEKFGHLLEAFEYGVPPHGGIALGFDRLVSFFAGEESIREVIAFPVNASGRTAVMDAPSEVAPSQLEELGIRVVGKKK
ncbi:aspartate--tRNA ligase [bacterium]|nr:aspartate--tRNA ligase [bacterium]